MEYKCELCDKQYASIFSLSNHNRKIHPSKKDIFRTKKDSLYYCNLKGLHLGQYSSFKVRTFKYNIISWTYYTIAIIVVIRKK